MNIKIVFPNVCGERELIFLIMCHSSTLKYYNLLKYVFLGREVPPRYPVSTIGADVMTNQGIRIPAAWLTIYCYKILNPRVVKLSLFHVNDGVFLAKSHPNNYSVTCSSSRNRWRNCKRNWSSWRPTWKERDFWSTWAKPRSWYLWRGSMCFRSLEKTSVARVSRVSAQIPFSAAVVQLDPQKMQWNP